MIGLLRLHGGCKSDKSAGPTRVFSLVRPAFVRGSPDWTRTCTPSIDRGGQPLMVGAPSCSSVLRPFDVGYRFVLPHLSFVSGRLRELL